MKKLVAVLVALLMVLGVTAALADDAEVPTYTCGDYEYQLLDDGTAMIAIYNGDARNLEIPREVDGHTVTSIGNGAFYLCDRLASITIPDSVNNIGAVAFYECRSLDTINIPDNVTSIGDATFYGCRNLTSIIIPESVTSIGNSAFYNCGRLTSITITDSVTFIGNDAFKSCPNLTALVSSDSYAAHWCKENGVKCIDPAVQTYTSGDYEYKLLNDDTAMITDYTGKAQNLIIANKLNSHSVTAIQSNAFFKCESLTSVTIPDGVTAIGNWAFYGCTNLASITIPDSVTSVGDNPFKFCSKLKEIVVSPDHPTLAIIDSVLFEKSTKTLVYYPSTLPEKNYVIPNGISVIGNDAFANCANLTSITIPDTVTSIGDNAFSCCFGLTSITIPDSVTHIGVNPFDHCDIRIVISPDHPTLAIIDRVLFEKNSQTLICYPSALTAKSYKVPDNVTVIGDYAFDSCEKLTSVTIPDSVTAIGDFAFSFCGSLASINIPNSVTSIGESAFLFDYSLTSITIPDSVTIIGSSAVYGCNSLTSAVIPASVTSIGEDAFSNCPNLTVTVTRDSYAAQWCKDNGVPYTYPDANDWLNN